MIETTGRMMFSDRDLKLVLLRTRAWLRAHG
jgi:hypothetical protein